MTTARFELALFRTGRFETCRSDTWNLRHNHSAKLPFLNKLSLNIYIYLAWNFNRGFEASQSSLSRLSLYLSCRFFSPSYRTRVTTTNSTSSTSAVIFFSDIIIPDSSFLFTEKKDLAFATKENSKSRWAPKQLFWYLILMLLCTQMPYWSPSPSFLMDAYSFIPRSTLEHMPYALHDSPLRISTDWVEITPRWLSHVFPSAAMLVAAISNRVLTNVNLRAGNQRDWLFIWTNGSSWFKVLEYRCVSKKPLIIQSPFPGTRS